MQSGSYFGLWDAYVFGDRFLIQIASHGEFLQNLRDSYDCPRLHDYH
jgi:hypothetical protein